MKLRRTRLQIFRIVLVMLFQKNFFNFGGIYRSIDEFESFIYLNDGKSYFYSEKKALLINDIFIIKYSIFVLLFYSYQANLIAEEMKAADHGLVPQVVINIILSVYYLKLLVLIQTLLSYTLQIIP